MTGKKQLIVDEVEARQHLRTQQPGSDLWSRSAKMTKRFRSHSLPPVPERSLYQAHNVTGSTGYGMPSVYYQSGDTFSHVTTVHDHTNNIGRSRSRTQGDYSIGNTGAGGASQEFYRGKVRHTSRNPFNPVSSTQEQNRLHSLAQHFPNLKSKYSE